MNDREIYMNAQEDASAAELARYLAEACGNDASLRERVEALFAADEQAEEEDRLSCHGVPVDP